MASKFYLIENESRFVLSEDDIKQLIYADDSEGEDGLGLDNENIAILESDLDTVGIGAEITIEDSVPEPSIRS